MRIDCSLPTIQQQSAVRFDGLQLDFCVWVIYFATEYIRQKILGLYIPEGLTKLNSALQNCDDKTRVLFICLKDKTLNYPVFIGIPIFFLFLKSQAPPQKLHLFVVIQLVFFHRFIYRFFLFVLRKFDFHVNLSLGQVFQFCSCWLLALEKYCVLQQPNKNLCAPA